MNYIDGIGPDQFEATVRGYLKQGHPVLLVDVEQGRTGTIKLLSPDGQVSVVDGPVSGLDAMLKQILDSTEPPTPAILMSESVPAATRDRVLRWGLARMSVAGEA